MTAWTVISPHTKDLGGGFLVRRALPAAQRQAVGPFLEDLTPIRFAELLEVQQPGFIVPPGWQSTD